MQLPHSNHQQRSIQEIQSYVALVGTEGQQTIGLISSGFLVGALEGRRSTESEWFRGISLRVQKMMNRVCRGSGVGCGCCDGKKEGVNGN